MTWQFLLTDLLGNVHGEVTEAAARKVVLPHLRAPSASFTVPVWHSLAPQILDTDCLVRAYRTDPLTGQRDLAFHGPIVTAEENTGEGAKSIAVTAAGPMWRLSKRLIPASKLAAGAQFGAEGALADLGTIAHTILQNTNSTHFTGVDTGTHSASTSGWVKYHAKNVAEAIAELASGLNSFEHRIRPTEPTAYANPENWPRIGLLDVAPIIGATKLDAVFEYGTTKPNIAEYKRTVSRETLLTSAIIPPPGWPESSEKTNIGTANVPIIVDRYAMVDVSDATQKAARGMFEEVLNDAGVLDTSLRTALADFHIAIRKNPRQIITFKPVINARPAPFVHYNVGDTVRARAVVRGTLRFDALFRIWGITFDVDQNGNENVELELVTP